MNLNSFFSNLGKRVKTLSGNTPELWNKLHSSGNFLPDSGDILKQNMSGERVANKENTSWA